MCCFVILVLNSSDKQQHQSVVLLLLYLTEDFALHGVIKMYLKNYDSVKHNFNDKLHGFNKETLTALI